MRDRKVRPWDFIAILQKHKSAPSGFYLDLKVQGGHLTYFYYMGLREIICQEHKTLRQVLDLHNLSLVQIYPGSKVVMGRLLSESGEKKDALNDQSPRWY